MSSVTATMRFGGTVNHDLKKMLSSLVGFPRLHHLMPSMGPFLPDEKAYKESISVFDITRSVCKIDNCLLKVDFRHGQLISSSLAF